MPPACQTKLILWPGSKAPLAISCYSSKGSGSVARWEPTGLCFALTSKVHYQSGEDIMVILCHHPHGLGLVGDKREKRYEWGGVAGHLSRGRAAHKDVDETRQKKWMRQCLLVAEKEGGGVFVNAFKCSATAEAVWWDLSWERRLQSKRTLLIFSSRIPTLHQPPLVFFPLRLH